MPSNVITYTATTSDFTINLTPRIQLDLNKKYEAALLSVNLYNSIPNITEANNKFKYSTDEGITRKIISLNKGSYEVQAINAEIERQMTINGDYGVENNKFYINLSANLPELKSIINITNKSYLLDFNIENSIGPNLGFPRALLWHYDFGYNLSPNIVDILKVNRVLVNVDFISGSYVNGYQSSAIYSFDPYKVGPGYKLDDRPNPKVTYYQVNTRNAINNIRIWLTDQNNELADLRGERITIEIEIREVINVKKHIIEAIRQLKQENIL